MTNYPIPLNGAEKSSPALSGLQHLMETAATRPPQYDGVTGREYILDRAPRAEEGNLFKGIFYAIIYMALGMVVGVVVWEIFKMVLK